MVWGSEVWGSEVSEQDLGCRTQMATKACKVEPFCSRIPPSRRSEPLGFSFRAAS